jgi:hypothetical protein
MMNSLAEGRKAGDHPGNVPALREKEEDRILHDERR